MAYKYRFFVRHPGDMTAIRDAGFTSGTFELDDDITYLVLEKDFEKEGDAVEFFLGHSSDCRITHLKMAEQ